MNEQLMKSAEASASKVYRCLARQKAKNLGLEKNLPSPSSVSFQNLDVVDVFDLFRVWATSASDVFESIDSLIICYSLQFNQIKLH